MTDIPCADEGIFPMTLYCSARSPFARKVLIALQELGLMSKVHCVATQVPALNSPQAFVAANPLGQLPTLVLGNGVPVYDSTVICEWLDRTFAPGRLIPPDPLQRLSCQRREALGNGLISKLTAWRRELGRAEAQQSTTMLAGTGRAVQRTLDALERDVVNWNSGALNTADITISCALAYLDFRMEEQVWRRNRPRLERWYAAVSLRPSVAAHPLASAGVVVGETRIEE